MPKKWKIGGTETTMTVIFHGISTGYRPQDYLWESLQGAIYPNHRPYRWYMTNYNGMELLKFEIRYSGSNHQNLQFKNERLLDNSHYLKIFKHIHQLSCTRVLEGFQFLLIAALKLVAPIEIP